MLWAETTQDPELRRRAFAGLRRFQNAPRPAETEPPQEVARAGRARLLRRGGTHETGDDRPPVILVPSLINPPDVMDLSPQRSLLRYLQHEGHDAYLLDWGEPDPADREQGLADHIESLLLPLLAHFSRPPVLIGYCLGGTLVIGAAARLAALGTPAQAVATIAAPWDFAQYDAAFAAQADAVWTQSRPSCEALGLVPMEVLQTGFWSLDPKRTIRKYADFLDMEDGSPAWRGFITLEDWANEGAPLTLAVGRELIEYCYGDNLTGRGDWHVGGTRVDPTALACPNLAIASTSDAIVPAATTPPLQERIDLTLGHVGMMIGGRAEEMLWKPLSAWIGRNGG
ncbi:MAG: alpha/beta hydrolase [Sphingobium sp.]|nr:alpha/beta hydrolase [Sphingobium sp.]